MAPSRSVTRTVRLASDLNSWPSLSRFEYSGMGRVWKSSALVRLDVGSCWSGLPADWKAELVGARQVMFCDVSTAVHSFVRFSALSSALSVSGRPRTVAVHLPGGVRTLDSVSHIPIIK